MASPASSTTLQRGEAMTGRTLTVLVQVDVEVLLGAEAVTQLAGIELLHRALLVLDDLLLLHWCCFRRFVHKIGQVFALIIGVTRTRGHVRKVDFH